MTKPEDKYYNQCPECGWLLITDEAPVPAIKECYCGNCGCTRISSFSQIPYADTPDGILHARLVKEAGEYATENNLYDMKDYEESMCYSGFIAGYIAGAIKHLKLE